ASATIRSAKSAAIVRPIHWGCRESRTSGPRKTVQSMRVPRVTRLSWENRRMRLTTSAKRCGAFGCLKGPRSGYGSGGLGDVGTTCILTLAYPTNAGFVLTLMPYGKHRRSYEWTGSPQKPAPGHVCRINAIGSEARSLVASESLGDLRVASVGQTS